MIVKDLAFRHPGERRFIFENISFAAHPGEISVILGPNGSGKTTLFKCITGLWHPAGGTIQYDGKNLIKLTSMQRAGLIAVVPQDHQPPFSYSVLDIILMGRAAHISAFSVPERRDYEKAEHVMDLLGIAHLKDHAYTRISGGERQLVLTARALAQQTPILLLDEPTSHLDFRHQLHVLRKIKSIARDKKLTVLMTLHDPNLAMHFADQVMVLGRGTLAAHGRPESIINEDMLRNIYGVEVEVLRNNGLRVIVPKAVE